MSLASGDDRAPLAPYVPPEVPEESTELEYGIEGTEALTFVAKTLTDRLAARLQGRAVAAGRIELDLRLDAAMLPAVADRAKACIAVAVDLPAPLSLATDLLAALRPKIERLVLEAPVLEASLRAPVLVHKRAVALSLFEPEPKAERALPRLVAELVSDLGPDAVSALVLGDSWLPEERSRLVPFDISPKGASPRPKAKKRRHMLSSVPEPTRLLPEPRVIPRPGVHVLRHLSRVECVEWWKYVPSACPSGTKPMQRRAVDYVQAWTDEGAAWIEIDRTSGTMRVRGWFD
jgi:protein ImuB